MSRIMSISNFIRFLLNEMNVEYLPSKEKSRNPKNLQCLNTRCSGSTFKIKSKKKKALLIDYFTKWSVK